jgi:hypothetical protein
MRLRSARRWAGSRGLLLARWLAGHPVFHVPLCLALLALILDTWWNCSARPALPPL